MQSESLIPDHATSALEESVQSKQAPPITVQYVRHRLARRYILRVTRTGIARVTIPRWGSIAEARRFAQEHVKWIEQQIAKLSARYKDEVGRAASKTVMFRGQSWPVNVVRDGERYFVVFGSESVAVTGPDTDVQKVIETHLRELAEDELPRRIAELAQSVGLHVRKVIVRNQKTRWGSCSRKGTISLNWRLVQAPIWVRDYLLWHELMHLREMNHSKRFWSLVASVCPDYKAAEQWIRQHSRELISVERTW